MSVEWKGLFVAVAVSAMLLGLAFGFGALVATTLPARSPAVAPPPGAAPPQPDPRVARGRLAFESNCASCHGANGQGVIGPSLRHSDMSDKELTTIITNGVPKKMPAFRKDLDAATIQAIVAYVKTLK